MTYVSLHHHTTFSYGDGYDLPKNHVEFCENAGMTAMAVTEHGNTSSHPALEKACEGTKVKPIFGLEGYIAPPGEKRKCHQTILAMDQIGYQNLNRLVSQSWRDFYQWPTIHLDQLEKYSEGLIVLSGCADSQLSCTLLGGKYYGDKRDSFSTADFANSVRLVEWYKSVFGDRFYLECQRFPGLGRTCALNPAFEKLGRECGVGLAATSDCHYVFARDNEMQKILHAAHRGSSVDAVAASWEYGITLNIPDSDERVIDDLKQTGLSDDGAYAAWINTSLIANRCNVKLPKVEPIKYRIDEKDFAPWV
jgi:DNA polymerase-3 subunit alpha